MATLSLAVAALLVVSAVALAATGDLTQPTGTAGCISQTGAGGCADGHALRGPIDVAVSPDGKSVYVASIKSDAVARFKRDTTTGAITQPAGSAGCISQTGSGPCADGHALRGPIDVAVSPDGKSVYVASIKSDAVARFKRDTTTGAITQPAGSAGCISQTGSGLCADGHALSGPNGVAVSPDGKSVYVTSVTSDALVRLKRNTATGAITQPAGTAGCISQTGSGPCGDGHGLRSPVDVAVSPDGKSVYVASDGSDAVARFNRNTTTGAISQPAGSAGCISQTGSGPCADGHALKEAFALKVSPDGNNVYVAAFGSDAVARLNRTFRGALTQPAGSAGCISQNGVGGCTGGHALRGPTGLEVSPDGKSVYATSQDQPGGAGSNAVARLDRTSTGALTQPAGSAGCVRDTGSPTPGCADGRGIDNPAGAAVSPEGNSVYVAGPGSDAVARFNRAP